MHVHPLTKATVRGLPWLIFTNEQSLGHTPVWRVPLYLPPSKANLKYFVGAAERKPPCRCISRRNYSSKRVYSLGHGEL